MATPRAQRIGIWVITAVMAVGSIGVYFVAIIANNNDSQVKQDTQQILADYQKKVTDQATALSNQYFAAFSPFASRVSSFEKQPAQEKLATVDLKVGDGETITDTTKFSAYYIGWNPDGTIFDQSIASTTLKTPISIDDGLKNASLITGWKTGMVGMNINGVRELTIPSSLAYGSTGQGADIPADTPIKFVVMAIPFQEAIPIPPELLSAY